MGLITYHDIHEIKLVENENGSFRGECYRDGKLIGYITKVADKDCATFHELEAE